MKKVLSFLLAIIMVISLCITGFAMETSSKLDGEPSDWARSEIREALAYGLVPESVNGNYTQDITRSEFCDLIVNLIEVISVKSIDDFVNAYSEKLENVSFPDTDSATVLAAAKLGIVNGRASGSFDPDANITRQEAAKMLALTAKVVGESITSESGAQFADKDAIYDWALEYVNYVYAQGIMKGTSTGENPNFSPLRTYTREQSILTALRLYGVLYKYYPTPTAIPVPSTPIINTLPTDAGEAGDVRKLEPMTLTEYDVLTIKDGVFMLEGKPFVEISFNKFDLLWQIIDPLLVGDMATYNSMIKKQEQSLKELNEMGFRSIRVFMAPWGPYDVKKAWYNPKNGESLLFKAIDEVVRMCEENDIKIVWCMGLTGFVEKWIESDRNGWHWAYGDYHMRELIADENCVARQEMYKYLDAVIQRYRNSKAVLTWEFANEITLSADILPGEKVYEGERMPTLEEIAKFFDDVAARIRLNDPLRLINSGGSSMREHQWNLYVNNKWQLDLKSEQYKALELLYKDRGCDIIDIHWYANNTLGPVVLDDETYNNVNLGLADYMEFAKEIGKPLMVGEIGIMPMADTPNYFADNSDVEKAKPFFQRQLDEIVDAGVQLSYWWQYGSDRPQDEGVGQFTLRKGLDDELLQMIIDANKRLKEKYNAN